LRKIVLTVTLALLASFALGGSPASASSPMSGTVCSPPGGNPTYQATSTATLTGATGSLTGYTGSATVATSINGVIGSATFSSTTTGSVTPP
jgi:hypothetical protein